MTGLTRIGVHVPEEREPVADVLAALGRPAGEIARFDRLYNLQTVPVAREGNLEGLLTLALRDLARSESLANVGLVLYAHTVLPQAPPGRDVLANTLEPFGIDNVPSFGIAHLNCAALFRAVELAHAWLQHSVERSVLIIGGDHASFIPQGRLVPGVSVMGDGAVAFLVRRRRARYRLLTRAWQQQTAFHRGLRMDSDETRAFNAVFLDHLGAVVDECLARAGRRLADVDWILPSNVNELTWSRFARAHGYPRERIFTELISSLGHTMTIDAFLNLEMAARGGRIRAGDTCLLLGVGTGSYFAATLVEASAHLGGGQ